MSSPEAEAFNPEAPHDSPKLKGKAFEPFEEGEDPSDHISRPKLEDVATGQGQDALAEPPDTLSDKIDHLQDTAQRSTASRTNGFTFKRTKSTEHVDVIDAEGEVTNGADDNADLESEGGSHLPSPPGTPDDVLSVQASAPSSPGSNIIPRRPSLQNTPTGSLRPFDRRFQSRLSISSSPLASPRAASPAFLAGHSRSSSLSGQGEDLDGDADDGSTPWDVIRWTKLKKLKAQLYSESGRRAYGEPTCINIFASIAVGTSRGLILIFDYHQTLLSVIGQNLKAVECGGITSLAISADYTTIAGGHAKGHIFTWEIGKSARPFLSIPPIPLGQIDGKKEDGHVQGTSVLHLGFLGTRHTALVSADDKGMAFSHLASRSLVGRVVKTTRILGRYPFDIATASRPRKPSSVLAFASLPLGNAPQPTDTMGLTAMLTPYLLVIVSTTPIAQTQHKLARPKEVASEAALSGCLAWFPAIKLKNDSQKSDRPNQIMQPRLAYCWSNVLTVMEVLHSEKEGAEVDPYKPPALQFRLKSRWKSDEAIVAVQWLNRQILCVVTVSQRLIIIEEPTMRATERFDLIQKHIYHHDYFARQLRSLVGSMDEEGSLHASIADAYYNSIKTFKGRVFLLGSYDVSVGALSNWADRLLALMEVGDFIGALKLATSFYLGGTEMITVGLPSDDDARHTMVRDKLLDMMGASLRYAFGLTANSVPIKEREQLQELATACVTACMSMGTTDFLFETAFEAFEDGSAEGIFLETLEPLILSGELTYLPPTVVKSLISHYTSLSLESRLEEMICHMDPRTMDIHQVTRLCKEHSLYDALIYVWNQALSDYITPMTELLALIIPLITVHEDGAEVRSLNSTNALKIFPYLSYILTGRSYPTGDIMSDSEAVSAKAMLYYFFFLGRPIQWPRGSSAYVLTKTTNHNNEPSFPYLRAVLEFDAPSFLSCLNEAFEDSFLNDDPNPSNLSSSAGASELSEDQVFGRSVNRQYIVSILLEVMNRTDFTPQDTIYLDMFIARNLPKYPQYLLFPGSTLQRVLLGLCNYPGSDIAEDCQLSAEYLLSVYHPPDVTSLIDAFTSAGFYRVLKTVFRNDKDYPRLMEMYFEDADSQSTVFDCVNELLRPASVLTAKQRDEVKAVIKENAKLLASIDAERAAETLSVVGPDLHHAVVSSCTEEPETQYKYLKIVFEAPDKNRKGKMRNDRDTIPEYGSLLELYIRLMCSYDFERVSGFLETLSPGDLKLDHVIPALEDRGAIDGVVLLMAREGLITEAMKKLVQHLGVLEAAFVGLLRGCVDGEQGYQENDSVGDMLIALQKFSKVGIWLCQGQMAALESKLRGSGRMTLKKALNSKTLALTAEEDLWLDLIDCVVHISRSASGVLRTSSNMNAMTPVSPSTASVSEMSSRPASRASSKSQRSHYSMVGERRLLAATHRLVHDVFTALLSATSASGQNTASFLRILRAFLNRAAITSPSLADLRNVLASIFNTYTYEEQLLALSGKLLEKDLFLEVEGAATLRQRGWKPKGQLCEGCGKKLWGTGAAGGIFAAWESKRIEAFEKAKDTKVEKQAKRERERFGSISKGKGKAMLAGSHDERPALPGLKENTGIGKDGVADAATGQKEARDKEVSNIIMVFHCGHIYHRSCLEDLHSKDAKREEGEGSDETPFSPVSRHETNVEEVAMRCVVCR